MTKVDVIKPTLRKILLLSLIAIFIIPGFILHGAYGTHFYGELGRNSFYFGLIFAVIYFFRSKDSKLLPSSNVLLLGFIIFEILCITRFAIIQNRTDRSVDSIVSTVNNINHTNEYTKNYANAGKVNVHNTADMLDVMNKSLIAISEKYSVKNKSIAEEQDKLITNFSKTFSSELLLNVASLKAAKKDIENYKILVDEQRDLNTKLSNDLLAEVTSRGLNNPEFLRGLKEGYTAKESLYNDYFNSKIREANVYSELVNLVENNIDHISFKDNQVHFEDVNVKNKYHELRLLQAQLISEQKRIIEEIGEMKQKALSTLAELKS